MSSTSPLDKRMPFWLWSRSGSIGASLKSEWGGDRKGGWGDGVCGLGGCEHWNEHRTWRSSTLVVWFLLTVLVRIRVLRLEDKPSPEEQELIQAPWVVSALPQCRAGPAWYNGVHFWECLDCRPCRVLCPEGLRLVALQGTALRAEIQPPVCETGLHSRVSWFSSLQQMQGRGTFGLFRCSSWICQPWCNASLDNCYGGSFFICLFVFNFSCRGGNWLLRQ